MLLLIDGIQINELNSGGFYGGAQYNLDNVERIEIVYGPASVVYGTNAVSGVVNIITKKPVTSQGLDVHAHTGTFNTKKIQTGYGYYNAQQDVGVRVSAQKKYTEKGNFGGSQGLFNWSDSVYNFENDISVDAKITYKSLTFGTNYLQKQSSVNLYYRTVGTAFKEGESLWNIGFLNSYITYDIKPTAKTIFTHNTYYRNTTLYPNTIAYITDTAQLRCFRPNYLIGTELIGKQQITDNLKCINGIALEHENLAKTYGETWSNSSEETPPRPPKPPLLQNYSANAFVQFSYTIFDQLEFTAGNRFDYNSSYKFVYTPNGSIMFHANRYNIKLLYMEAFRAPKPWDYNWGVGNSHLQPEEIHSLELNSNFSITPHLLFETSVYKNRMYNMLVKNKTNTAWTNADTINLIGIETELQYLRKVYQAYINYTYTYFYDKPDNRIEEIAPHTCNAGITFTPNSYITATIRCNYISEKLNANSLYPIIDDALICNTKISFNSQQNIQWFVDVRNIFNTEYYHSSNRNVTAYRQPQRTILLGLTWHLE